METFKELIETLVRTENNPEIEKELDDFLNSDKEIFNAKIEIPTQMLLATIKLPVYYPKLAEAFTNMLMKKEKIEEKEELLYDKSTSMES